MICKDNRLVLLTILATFFIAGLVSAQDRVVDLAFGLPTPSDSDTSRTLQSVITVQKPGGPCQKGLYLVTHFGDRRDLFERENQRMIENPLLNQSWRYCSIFSTSGDDAVLMGRNWDNENVGSIIVSLYQPPDGYASVSFSRAIDLGFPLNLDVKGMASDDLGLRLLLAPFYAYDGMNEHGLAVGVAGSRNETVELREGKELIYVPFLIRKILDQAKTVQEAVSLADRYVPFDLNEHSLNSHLFMVDASGRSAILEYAQGTWRVTGGDKTWQVLSTKPVYHVPDSTLREQCWRYRGMSEALESSAGKAAWNFGIAILQEVSQIGTTWSTVYVTTTRELYFSVYQQWDTVYHLKLPTNR